MMPVRLYPRTLWRRLLILMLSLASGGGMTLIWADLLTQNGVTGFDVLQIALFGLNLFWISIFFWSSMVGLVRYAVGRLQPGLIEPPPYTAGQLAPDLAVGKKTAVLVPVYNEDPVSVFGNVAAMVASLQRLGQADHFHFFVLSDTTDPEVWVSEEIVWANTVTRLGLQGRLFYRRRPKNTARKAGNIADFCTRYGAHYDVMVVADADSLLGGETIVRLTRYMKANPEAGIIQGLPSIIGANSLFARAQQFAVGLYGPVLAAGINFWHQGDGNYWGHNAAISVPFFTELCGLPTLPGKPPFGGHILSHDFVEAALMRRGGKGVWLVPEIAECYEQTPPTLIDSAARDRRWIQGNLQHSKVLGAKGLHPMSRLHLFMGITAYMIGLTTLLFLLVGLASQIYSHVVPPDYFPDTKTLFPSWPIFDGDLALSLLALTFAMLTLPKVLTALLVCCQRGRAALYGGRLRLLVSVLFEHLFTFLLSPVLMLVHASLVLDVLMGRDSGWARQNRGDADTGWQEALQRHRGHMLIGAALAVGCWHYTPSLFWWLSPVMLGLLLAVPLSVLSSRASVGLWLRRKGLLLVPEEVTPPQLWLDANAASADLAKVLPRHNAAVDMVLTDAAVNAIHLSLLPVGSDQFADPDELVKARRKIALKVSGQPMPPLSRAEVAALLYDAETISRLPLRLAPALPQL